MRVGETGVGEMGVGKMGVGEMGVGEMGIPLIFTFTRATENSTRRKGKGKTVPVGKAHGELLELSFFFECLI